MASISLRNVCKIYPGNVQAVDNFNLEIQDTEFIVFVGPSGCGKSTTLRMIAGLEEISSGEIYIGDRLVNDVAPKDRDIAMVFQNYALYPNKTVGENMGFALKMRGIPTEERKEKVAEAARLLDLTDYLDRKPAKLSGGQRQRVAMGRAIVREPQVFCMDEPLSNLDAKLRVQTRSQIAALQRRLGTTTVYVTHDQVEAMTMGDRVAVLKNGQLQQFSTPADLYDRPTNAFVAGFIGSPAMNLFIAPVRDDAISIGGSAVDLDDEARGLLRRSGLPSVIVGIRPEHLAIGGASGVDADVELLEELGAESYLYARVDDPSITTLDGDPVTLVARTPHRAPAKLGDTVRLHQSDRAVHLFDPSTGDRLG